MKSQKNKKMRLGERAWSGWLNTPGPLNNEPNPAHL
jgi:hypothetical protein